MPKNVLTLCGDKVGLHSVCLRARSALFLSICGLGLSLSAAAGQQILADQFQMIKVDAQPIEAFTADQDRDLFGALRFVGGMSVTSPAATFGGFSGLSISADGSELLAVGDRNTWFAGHIERDGKKLSDLTQTRLWPLLDIKGGTYRFSDAEGLIFDDHHGKPLWLLAVEGDSRRKIQVFDAVTAKGTLVVARPRPGHVVQTIPDSLARISGNRTLEAVARAPATSDLSGQLLVFAERQLSGGHHRAWALTTRLEPGRSGRMFVEQSQPFRIKRRDKFDITAAEFLPSGDLILLERRFAMLEGGAMRLRRISRHDLTRTNLKRGLVLDGMDLMTADLSHQIDNMEGMSIWQRADGTPVITLISDDNFNFFQRTLLLEFELRPEEFGVVPKARPADTM